MFAVDDLDAGDPIEACPLLVLDTSEVVGILHDMVVRTPSGPALPLGFGSLYNHADDPNAAWSTADDLMVVRARRPILAGEEITIFYGDSWSPGGASSLAE